MCLYSRLVIKLSSARLFVQALLQNGQALLFDSGEIFIDDFDCGGIVAYRKPKYYMLVEGAWAHETLLDVLYPLPQLFCQLAAGLTLSVAELETHQPQLRLTEKLEYPALFYSLGKVAGALRCVPNVGSHFLKPIMPEQVVKFEGVVSSVEAQHPIFIVNHVGFTGVLIFVKTETNVRAHRVSQLFLIPDEK